MWPHAGPRNVQGRTGQGEGHRRATPEEYAFIGHPENALNIPVAFVTYQRKDGKTEYGPKMNPDFVAEVTKMAGQTDGLQFVWRNETAANQLPDGRNCMVQARGLALPTRHGCDGLHEWLVCGEGDG